MAVAFPARYAQRRQMYLSTPPPPPMLAKWFQELQDVWSEMTPSEQATVGPMPPPPP